MLSVVIFAAAPVVFGFGAALALTLGFVLCFLQETPVFIRHPTAFRRCSKAAFSFLFVPAALSVLFSSAFLVQVLSFGCMAATPFFLKQFD